MRLLLLGVLVFFFVALPMYALNALVMPEVTQLQQSYAQQDQTVQALFPQQ